MLSYETVINAKNQPAESEEEFTYEKPENLDYTLDSNHDFFVLIETVQKEFEIRTKLVTQLAALDKVKCGNVEAPIVNVLIEGGESAIETVSKGLKQDIAPVPKIAEKDSKTVSKGLKQDIAPVPKIAEKDSKTVSKGPKKYIPCIVVSGTGRAADIFAECIRGIYLTSLPLSIPD